MKLWRESRMWRLRVPGATIWHPDLHVVLRYGWRSRPTARNQKES